MPHLDAAYNLARWLAGNEHDAEDIVQDSFVRAFRFFDGFRGGDGRAWLLAIVRNTTYTWLQKSRNHGMTVFDEEKHDIEDERANPESLLQAGADRQLVRKALEELPAEFREVMVLRELEGMSYKEVAEIAGVPIGTVMSRLARARKQLQRALVQSHGEIAK